MSHRGDHGRRERRGWAVTAGDFTRLMPCPGRDGALSVGSEWEPACETRFRPRGRRAALWACAGYRHKGHACAELDLIGLTIRWRPPVPVRGASLG